MTRPRIEREDGLLRPTQPLGFEHTTFGDCERHGRLRHNMELGIWLKLLVAEALYRELTFGYWCLWLGNRQVEKDFS